jgi:2-haloacid dehalogenase
VYRTFSEITRAALKHAATEQATSLSDDQIQELMNAYNGLQVFPEIPAAMELLKSDKIDPYVFSNGTDAMVSTSMKTSPELSKTLDIFGPGKLVTVEDVNVFKPDKRTYDHLVEKVGMSGKPELVWVVTANPFDAVGARAAGLNCAWIDRAGTGWVDALGDLVGVEPTIVAKGVDEAVQSILLTGA